jgi:hypothetical protein
VDLSHSQLGRTLAQIRRPPYQLRRILIVIIPRVRIELHALHPQIGTIFHLDTGVETPPQSWAWLCHCARLALVLHLAVHAPAADFVAHGDVEDDTCAGGGGPDHDEAIECFVDAADHYAHASGPHGHGAGVPEDHGADFGGYYAEANYPEDECEAVDYERGARGHCAEYVG